MPSITFNVAASGDDGQVERAGTAWPPAGSFDVFTTPTAFAPLKFRSGATRVISVALCRWDTSSIPDDATIVSAVFRAYVTAKGSGTGRDLTAEWYEAGTIDSGDWTSTVGTDAHAGTAISAITESADNDFSLNNLSSISKAGYTGLRLHISGGDPADPANHSVSFAAFDHATLTEPRLIVEYTLPVIGGGAVRLHRSLSLSFFDDDDQIWSPSEGGAPSVPNSGFFNFF